jgi:hypothetical protein
MHRKNTPANKRSRSVLLKKYRGVPRPLERRSMTAGTARTAEIARCSDGL